MRATTGKGTVSARQSRRMLRRFDRFVQRDDILVDRYGKDTAAVMRQEMREELARLIPQIPHVGSRRENPLAPQLPRAAWALASYRVVLARGGTLEDTGELIHHLTRAEVQRLPRMLRPLLRRYLFSGLRRRQAQKEARRSQQRRYPDDWVYEYVPGDGTSYDLGRDYTECAIVKFLHAQGADELCPYLCDTDHVMADVMGVAFRRTKTLAWGCDRCDFRYSKNGSTAAAWPPRFVERTCGQAPTTQPESVRASTAR